MRIAVLDYRVVPTNPIGGCHLRMLKGLCREHQFTVFAPEFQNPDPDRIEWVRVPVPKRPLALLFIAFHAIAPFYYWFYRLRRGVRFDAVQIVESKFSFGDISYAHFCHRAFLRHHWSHIGAKGLRGRLRWLNHYLHSLLEPIIYRRIKRIVVPSAGLARELKTQYPSVSEKIHILSNPVDVERMRRPRGFNRDEFRSRFALDNCDIVLLFSALGHFERKGLPLILAALRELENPKLKLLVVGGQMDVIARYISIVTGMGLQNQVIFVGMQRDVRPFLWAADAFMLPSFYEAFPLVSLEAAAAGVPAIVTHLHGVEELIEDGRNGIFIEPTVPSVCAGIRRFLKFQQTDWQKMGHQAAVDVGRFDTSHFLDRWRQFLQVTYA